MKRFSIVALLAGACVAAALVSGSAPASPRAAEGDVYRVTVFSAAGQWTEWIAPVSGRWRIELGDSTYVFTGGSYAAISGDGGAYVRTGSAAFLGSLADRAVARDAVRAYVAGTSAVSVTTLSDGKTELRFTKGAASYVAVIEEKLSAADADARKLFDVPVENVRSTTTERPLGARSSLAISAYWLGPTYSTWKATAAVDQYSGPRPAAGGQSPLAPAVISYTAFYELPAANGRTSAFLGVRAPAGEIRVLSQSVKSWIAKRAIQAYNGKNGNLRYKPWPRTSVRLRSGETATVIPDRSEGAGPVRPGFAVITKTTLVNVAGSFKTTAIPSVAAQLRPIGAQR